MLTLSNPDNSQVPTRSKQRKTFRIKLLIAHVVESLKNGKCVIESLYKSLNFWFKKGYEPCILSAVHLTGFPKTWLYRASDISRGRRPTKFRYFREIWRNFQKKNTKYREICQKYFQIHVGKTYLILILAIRPVLFTPNVQIYLETSSLQRVNNVSKLPGVLR